MMTLKELEDMLYDITQHINELTMEGKDFPYLMNEDVSELYPGLIRINFTFKFALFVCEVDVEEGVSIVTCTDTTGVKYKLGGMYCIKGLLKALKNNRDKSIDLEY